MHNQDLVFVVIGASIALPYEKYGYWCTCHDLIPANEKRNDSWIQEKSLYSNGDINCYAITKYKYKSFLCRPFSISRMQYDDSHSTSLLMKHFVGLLIIVINIFCSHLNMFRRSQTDRSLYGVFLALLCCVRSMVLSMRSWVLTQKWPNKETLDFICSMVALLW